MSTHSSSIDLVPVLLALPSLLNSTIYLYFETLKIKVNLQIPSPIQYAELWHHKKLMSRNSTCALCAKPRLLISLARVSCFKLRRWILVRLCSHTTTLPLPSSTDSTIYHLYPGSSQSHLPAASLLSTPDAARSSWYSILHVFLYLSRLTEPARSTSKEYGLYSAQWLGGHH